MLKKALSYSFLISLLASCSSLKNTFTRPSAESQNSVSGKDPKFLNQEVTAPASIVSVGENSKESVKEGKSESSGLNKKKSESSSNETAFTLQNKYAALLNTSADEVRNIPMYEFIDDWYGTPYKLGGTTKDGIDCSAFTQYLFAAVYSITLPRTAREQYKLTKRISRTQLKEGDLIFFSTNHHGISHVGVYLQNNKFVHASTSGGVVISDIFDEYWVRRFVGVGRLESPMASGN